MMLGALLDAGLSLDSLTAELAKLPLAGYHISAERASRGIITGTQVKVAIDKSNEERRLEDILSLIEKSTLSEEVRKRSALIFRRLAEAEAKVHCRPVEEVHFHEVGAVDAIVDVVGAVIGLEILGIQTLFSSPLPSGCGTAETEHSVIPVPAPATLELIAASGSPIRPTPSPELGELVTPTGAAIVTTLASFENPTFSLERIGYGVGSRELATMPNVLPLWIGESAAEEQQLLLLETNIDDMIPELYGYVMERLFEQGALDVWLTPIQMKKSRPATMLSVLAPSEAKGKVVDAMLRETSTLGVRVQRIARHESGRETIPFDSSLGRVTVKVKRFGEARVGLSPEFEDCRRLAQEHGLPLQEVYRIVTAEASAQLLK
jgi:hypothetical protein